MSRHREFDLLMREAIRVSRPSKEVTELLGRRAEHEHITGCPNRAGKPALCTCDAIVQAVVDARLEFTFKKSRATMRGTADSMLVQLCARVDALALRAAGRPGGRELLAVVDYFKRACGCSFRGEHFRAALFAGVASVGLDELERAERERAVSEALDRFPRQSA